MTVPEVIVLRQGENITLACNLTEGEHGGNTGLKRISWYKDGVLKKTLRNPEPGNPQDSLEPFKLTNVEVKDGGKYTCLLVVLLRNNPLKNYSVSDSTMVESEYTLLSVYHTVHDREGTEWGEGGGGG